MRLFIRRSGYGEARHIEGSGRIGRGTARALQGWQPASEGREFTVSWIRFLREQSYVGLDDWHMICSLKEEDNVDEVCFFSLLRECELHDLLGQSPWGPRLEGAREVSCTGPLDQDSVNGQYCN